MGKYFTIEELCRSNTADAKGIDNTPNNAQKERLKDLIENVLDPLREAYGKPIYVNSGFRNDKLNKEVGGVVTSQHRRGEAADISAGSIKENEKLFNLIQELNLPFDQLINESNFSWVHVSYSQERQRKQILKL
jgi:uncharacterized protein YcbK (DUF882 family)